jgi:proteasome lid subunit RPN8/RPN11
MKNTLIKPILAQISEEADLSANFEICGFLGYDEETGRYVWQRELNASPDPQNFCTIDPFNYLKFQEDYEVFAVFHSHIIGSAKPSEFDIKMSGTSCFPFLIYSVQEKKFHIYCPPNHEIDVNKLDRLKEQL